MFRSNHHNAMDNLIGTLSVIAKSGKDADIM